MPGTPWFLGINNLQVSYIYIYKYIYIEFHFNEREPNENQPKQSTDCHQCFGSTSPIHLFFVFLCVRLSKENVETLLEFLGLVIGKAIFEGFVPWQKREA